MLRVTSNELGPLGMHPWGLLACNAEWLGDHTDFTVKLYFGLLSELRRSGRDAWCWT